MKNIALPTTIIACLFVALWQLSTRARQEWTVKEKGESENRAGMQCPALYGVPEGKVDQDLPGSVKHCPCEIGAMLAQTDGTVRCSYCGKQDK